MQAKAKLRYLRMSPKKVRLVADLIRGMKVEEALTQLNFLTKAAKRPIAQLLNSAIANAENNFELKKDNLYIKEIRVDQAGMLKRWKPRAHGRATPIRKKLSHIIVVLDEIKPTAVKKKKKTKKTDEKVVKVSSLDQVKELPEAKKLTKKSQDKKDIKEHEKEADKDAQDVRMEGKHRHQQHQDKRSMKGDKGFINRIFNRKSG
jgi:large subunit ribosomal protein L22